MAYQGNLWMPGAAEDRRHVVVDTGRGQALA